MQGRHDWDWEKFEQLLTAPKRAWSRDLSPEGLDPTHTWSASGPALEITGDEMDGAEHTAVWLTLALAARGSVGEAGSGVSLATYLAHLPTGNARRAAILAHPQGTDTTVAQVIRALRGSRDAPLPDPLLLAQDLADVLGEDEDARTAVSRQWSRLSAETTKLRSS